MRRGRGGGKENEREKGRDAQLHNGYSFYLPTQAASGEPSRDMETPCVILAIAQPLCPIRIFAATRFSSRVQI